MATSILSSKFDGDDIVVWLREFDACAFANGWKDEDKIKKLPAFLRGRAATHFYATPVAERATYDATTKKLKQALCPPVERENYYAKFGTRMLRTGEDPSVYKWELEQLLEKADPNLAVEAKSALLSRQFMRGLPSSGADPASYLDRGSFQYLAFPAPPPPPGKCFEIWTPEMLFPAF